LYVNSGEKFEESFKTIVKLKGEDSNFLPKGTFSFILNYSGKPRQFIFER